MSLAVSHMLDELFLEAERSGMLLAPSDRATRMALSRRMRRGDVVRPFRNMYAPASMWDALPWQERTSRIIHTYAALYPSCVFCSYTAAFILGLQVPKYRVTGGLHILSGKGVAGQVSCIMRYRIVPLSTGGSLPSLPASGQRTTAWLALGSVAVLPSLIPC